MLSSENITLAALKRELQHIELMIECGEYDETILNILKRYIEGRIAALSE